MVKDVQQSLCICKRGSAPSHKVDVLKEHPTTGMRGMRNNI